MSEDEILSILIKFADYLQIGDIWMNGFRKIGMLLVRGLVYFVDLVSMNFIDVLSVLNFRNNDTVSELLTALQPIQSMLLGFAILIIGLVLFLGKNTEMRNVPLNAFLIICALSMLPSLLTDGVRLTEAISSEMTAENEGLGFMTVKNNVIDIYELGGAGWTTEDIESDNYLENLNFFDENERIEDAKAVDPDGILNYKAVNKQGGSGYEIKKMDEGDSFLDGFIKKMVTPTYYRWKINWIPIFITLISLALAVGLFVIRSGRLGIEVVFNYIWTNITAFFHIRDLRKFKQAFTEIFVGLIALASMFVLFYLYIGYNTYISNSNRYVLIQALLYVGGAWLLFDGPAIVQKQLGIDAGLSTAGGILTSMGAAKAANIAMNSVEKAANTTSGIMGILSGIREGNKESSDEQESKNENGENQGINSSVENDSAKKSENGAESSGVNREAENDSSSQEESNTNETTTVDEGLNEQTERENEKVEDSSGGTNQLPEADTDDSSDGINKQLEEHSEANSEGEASLEQPTAENSDSIGTNDQLEGKNENQGINDELAAPNSSSKDDTFERVSAALSSSQEKEKQEETESSPTPEGISKQDQKKEPVKPKHPLSTFTKEQLSTPKAAKNNKSTVGNLYESHQKGKALGRDLVQYTKDRKTYKEEKAAFTAEKKKEGN